MSIIEAEKITELLSNKQANDLPELNDIFDKALELKGLELDEISCLLNIDDNDIESLERLFDTAFRIKEEIYGSRLVIFAPLYISNYCSNNCLYCGFRAENKMIVREILSFDEIVEQTRLILEQGHKRVLLLMGENHYKASFDYLEGAIEAVYSAVDGKGSSIRRINLEIAPLSNEEFQRLSKLKIGTYTVFQETYNRETYHKMHPSGKKADYDWRLETMDRALQNGMHDVGIGALFGLYDYRFEVLALIQHAFHLDKTYGIGPHTISIPRIQPAQDAPFSHNIPYPVTDIQMKKLIAVLRCAVPYTGMILSTREPIQLRRELFHLGISQISAGSRTSIGGYKQALNSEQSGQFDLNDCRTSGEIIEDVIKLGYVPSFCTSCYRLGRVGKDFMDSAKPGLIKLFCHPNGLTTLKEYLEDYADDEVKKLGNELIKKELDAIPNRKIREITEENLRKIEQGTRDIYL